MKRRCANDLILRTLTLLQIQILRFPTDHRKVKLLLHNWLWYVSQINCGID
ncbi:hypothetical protein [Paenibacillus polymyxa]|uniref:hypothetical protein n=1 Tax=Paenibacillus polymyxa TaxID=1406 RepID=UPI001CA48527|nr:hypothetical protein [Paenibacillus polymyxa]